MASNSSKIMSNPKTKGNFQWPQTMLSFIRCSQLQWQNKHFKVHFVSPMSTLLLYYTPLTLGSLMELSRSHSVTQLLTSEATCPQQPLKPNLGLLGTRGIQTSKRQLCHSQIIPHNSLQVQKMPAPGVCSDNLRKEFYHLYRLKNPAASKSQISLLGYLRASSHVPWTRWLPWN